jgi:hypothetical protein
MDNDTFTKWNNFADEKPTYDFDVIVEFEDGRKWIGSWGGDHWNFSKPRIFDLGVPVKRWMAFPE